MTHYLKFAIIHFVLAAIVAAAFISGSLKLLLDSEAKWIVLGLSTVLIYGLFNIAQRTWWRAAFASQILVRCGIVAMAFSLLLALQSIAGGGESAANLMILVSGIMCSVFSIGSSVYIDITAHFLGDTDGSQE